MAVSFVFPIIEKYCKFLLLAPLNVPTIFTLLPENILKFEVKTHIIVKLIH